MDIGVPRERRHNDSRVGLTPAGVELLTAEGHTCYVELGAGLGAGFADTDYQKAGARIVYSGEEVYGRAELVLKVTRPTLEEFEWLRRSDSNEWQMGVGPELPENLHQVLHRAYDEVLLADTGATATVLGYSRGRSYPTGP